MDLSSSEWLVVILLLVGVVLLVIGLIRNIRWGIVLVGGLLTAVAVFLIVQMVGDDSEPAPSPAPTLGLDASPSPPLATSPTDPELEP